MKLKLPVMLICFCQTLMWVQCSLSGEVVPLDRSTTSTSHSMKENEPFLIMNETTHVNRLKALGWIDINPGHISKPLSEVIERAKELKREKKVAGVRVMLCRWPNQRETLPQLFPIADQLAIWVFNLPSTVGPTPDDVIWPMYNNPLINRIREIRSFTNEKPLFAIINTGRYKNEIWGINRVLNWEEIRWMVYAAIGAGCQGTLWTGGGANVIYNRQITELEQKIRTHAIELGQASLVKWVKPHDDAYVSTLASEEKLFVVLLNPDYMVPAPGGETIDIPLEVGERQGEIVITPPKGCRVKSGIYLNGASLKPICEKDTLRVKYHFYGGGEILIFDLGWISKESTNEKISDAHTMRSKANHDKLLKTEKK